MINGKTRIIGVIGYPVEHSLSPVMHNAAIKDLGVNYVYIPWPVSPANLAAAINGFAAVNVAGFNITIPHKQAILPFLDSVTPVAQAVGAVNTVWQTPAGWAGTNTDVEGFVFPLKKYQWQWSEIEAIVLGIGGAARAVIAGLSELGIKNIHCFARDLNKLKAFEESWQEPAIIQALKTYPWSELTEFIPNSDLLINTTPLGMYPHIKEMPLTKEQMGLLKSDTIVYDLIYTPNPTQFLKTAHDNGAIAIDGLEMLVQQGAAALEIWLQQPVPVDIMRNSLIATLGL